MKLLIVLSILAQLGPGLGPQGPSWILPLPIPLGPSGTPSGGSGPSPSSALLLEDNVSMLLLENGTDHLCLESGC